MNGVYCIRSPHAHMLMHTPTPLTCVPLAAAMAVFCCVVLRDVALAEAARTSSRKKVVLLPTAVTCSISLSLSFTLIPTVCQAERWLPFMEHPLHSTALCTSREGVRNAVSHSLKWPVAPCSGQSTHNKPVVEDTEIHCVEVLSPCVT